MRCPECGRPLTRPVQGDGTCSEQWHGRESLDSVDELHAVLAALVLFAPSRGVATDPFARTVLRAAQLLEQHNVKLSRNDVDVLMSDWPALPPRRR